MIKIYILYVGSNARDVILSNIWKKYAATPLISKYTLIFCILSVCFVIIFWFCFVKIYHLQQFRSQHMVTRSYWFYTNLSFIWRADYLIS